MKLRDFGLWVIPSLLLLASGVPRTTQTATVAPDSSLTQSSNNAIASTGGGSRSIHRVPDTQGQDDLDCYDSDARHLLWKYANSNSFTRAGNTEVRLAMTGIAKKGTISLNEDISDSKPRLSCRADPSTEQLKAQLAGYSVKFLVVTLPDPIASHEKHLFDSALESIQAAVGAAGFTMDRYDLPWKPEDLSSTTAENLNQGAETRPGLILFRREPQKRELLLTFLVGEEPTSGIHKLAFSSALEQATELSWELKSCSADDLAGPCNKIGLLTPYFSGSADSLSRTLNAFSMWAHEHKSLFGKRRSLLHFAIISGAASSVHKEDFSFLKNEELYEFDKQPFKATIGYGPDIRDRFLRYLHEHLGVAPNEIAILRESNTAYGQSFSPVQDVPIGFLTYLVDEVHNGDSNAKYILNAVINNVSKMHPSNVPTESMDEGPAQIVSRTFSQLSSDDDPHYVSVWQNYQQIVSYVDLPFPLHISTLRGSSEGSNPSRQITTLLANSRAFFPIWSPPSPGRDQLPSFSQELDKPEADVAMFDLLSILASEHIHYVGIVATDTQDAIYLAKTVNEHCPDTTIFLLTSNLFFLNPDIAAELGGTIMVSTYPLFSMNQHFTFPFPDSSTSHSHMQFSSNADEGIFNAVEALIEQPERIKEYDAPFSFPEEQRHPPIWITAIGKRDFVPLDVLQQPIGSETYFYHAPSPTGIDLNAGPELPTVVTPSMLVLFISATVVCLWLSITTLLPGVFGMRDSTWHADVWHAGPRRVWAIALFLLSLALVYLLIAGVIFLPDVAVCTDCSPAVLFQSPISLAIPSVVFAFLLMSFCFQTLTLPLWFIWHAVKRFFRGLFTKKERISGTVRRLDTLLSRTPGFIREAALPFIFVALAIVVGGALLTSLMLYCFHVMTFATRDSFGNAAAIFAAWRYANPGGGVSPFPPLLLSSLAILAWTACSVRRTAMLENGFDYKGPAEPNTSTLLASCLGFSSISLADVPEREGAVHLQLKGMSGSKFADVILLCTVYVLVLFGFAAIDSSGSLHFVKSFEGPVFDRLVAILFFVGYAASAFNFLRFIETWRAFRGLLERLSWHPLRESCALLNSYSQDSETAEEHGGHSAVTLPRLSFTSPMPTFTALEFSTEQAKRLCNQTLSLDPSIQSEMASKIRLAKDEILKHSEAAWSALGAALSQDSRRKLRESTNSRRNVQRSLSALSTDIVTLLEPSWPTLEARQSDDAIPEETWTVAAGSFLASRILEYCRGVFAQLCNLLAFSIVGFMLMLMAASSYPFPRSDTLLRCSWMVLLVAIGITTWIFVQINRDRILSMLSGGTPGKIDWNSAFFGHLALYAGLPVLTLLGVRFPATINGIVNWIVALVPGGH
jgi:hypothetical protein